MSNIPYLPLSVPRETAQRELGLKTGDFALGFFGTLHDTRLLARVEDAARAVSAAGLNPVVLYIGPHGKAMQAALPTRQVLDQGALAAHEISRRFAAMDLYLATFVDGVSTRRGSLMAALQHGTAVVGTSGHLTDTLWGSENGRSIALAPANDALAFAQLVEKLVGDADKRGAMAKAAYELYQREFAVEVAARRMMATLDSLSDRSKNI
jgi:glycosyltransferase involved in cell wall biosynthesis